jgi:antitoxin component YwqK of YwqJK toxin-antitoxin module
MPSTTFFRRFPVSACLVAASLVLAGCDDTDESASPSGSEVKAPADDSESAKSEKQVDTGTEHYEYHPTKKKSVVEEVAPSVVKGKEQEEVTYPRDAKKPEIIAHVKAFSDNSTKFNGPYVEYRTGGEKKHSEGNFKDDKRDGVWKYYHPNGQVAKEVNYVDGKLDGQWTQFNEDGSKEVDVSYKSGARDGMWTFYSKPEKDKKQTIVMTQNFSKGILSGQMIQYYPNGQKAYESTLKAGHLEGMETRWYPKGAKRSETNYRKGVPDGTVTIWDESGKVVLQREYRDGKPLKNTAKEATADKPDADKSDAEKPKA